MIRPLVLKNQRSNHSVPLSGETLITENLKIIVTDDKIKLIDFGSSQKTLVNSFVVPPHEEKTINIGDFIQVGSELYKLELLENILNTDSATLADQAELITEKKTETVDKIEVPSPEPRITEVAEVNEKLESTEENEEITLTSIIQAPPPTIPIPNKVKTLHLKKVGFLTILTGIFFGFLIVKVALFIANKKETPSIKSVAEVSFNPSEFLKQTEMIGTKYPKNPRCADGYSIIIEQPDQYFLKLGYQSYLCKQDQTNLSMHYSTMETQYIDSLQFHFSKSKETCDPEHLKSFFSIEAEVLPEGPNQWTTKNATAKWASPISSDLTVNANCDKNHHFWITGSSKVWDISIITEFDTRRFITNDPEPITANQEIEFRKIAKQLNITSERSIKILEERIKAAKIKRNPSK